MEEGKKTRDKIDDDRQKLLKIKQDKIGTMGNLSIPPKYQFELKNKKISF